MPISGFGSIDRADRIDFSDDAIEYIAKRHNPTDPFTHLELRNPSINGSELHLFRLSQEFEALKLGKGRP